MVDSRLGLCTTRTTNARLTLAFFLCALAAGRGASQDVIFELKDGMIIGPGKFSEALDIGKARGMVGQNSQVKVPTSLVLMDGLRYTYFNESRKLREPIPVNETPVEIKINQQVYHGEPTVPKGRIVDCSPFDVYGRRICFVRSPTGVVPYVQGITEITTNYVKVEGLKGEAGQCEWDMRIALSNFDSQLLRDILVQNANPTKSNDFLEIVNLFRSAKRFMDARIVLGEAILRFPELERNKADLKSLDQDITDQLFSASDQAQTAGQFDFAKSILENIDKAGLSLETQLKVKAKLEALKTSAKENEELIGWIATDINSMAEGQAKSDFMSVLPEIKANLNADTSLRFTDYRLKRDDKSNIADQLAARAISGWIYGSSAGIDKSSVVASGVRARKIITEFLSKPTKDNQLIEDLLKLESGTPELVAKILANMAPPLSTPESAMATRSSGSGDNPQSLYAVQGRYQIEVPLQGDMIGSVAKYTVQLPPEYNPFRRYPCVFSLPGDTTNTEWQVDWWAGRYVPEMKRCSGEASKLGYIVVSPDWAEPKQPQYYCTENEHAMVLAPLRDAMRRFSIDTDRVFLSGHFMGADAAWDIALAHPDLWAGNIVISGEAKKFAAPYRENSLYVPSYFVAGEYDFFVEESNGPEWTTLQKDNKNSCLVTLYQGRKPDHFQEELPRIMQWMSFPDRVRKTPRDSKKDFKFEVTTVRAGDKFFWWFQTDRLFEEKLAHPLLLTKDAKAGGGYKIESSIVQSGDKNIVVLGTIPAKTCTILLSPDIIDFSKETIEIRGKGKNVTLRPKPETRVMLEDVRGRADRQHPTWMRVDLPK